MPRIEEPRLGSADSSYSQIVADATSRVVRQQLDAGINVISDGEIAKCLESVLGGSA
jgi:methionine synthase II (cobalamin-independent)